MQVDNSSLYSTFHFHDRFTIILQQICQETKPLSEETHIFPEINLNSKYTCTVELCKHDPLTSR